MSRREAKPSQQSRTSYETDRKFYAGFDQIDGTHPWQTEMPESCVLYQTRVLSDAKSVYFNFVLAKEMGLIPKNHPHKMNSVLEKKLVETFALQIINEYDEKSGSTFKHNTIKPNKYMATRYLQLQHASRVGKTSGDGRSIWNGIVRNNTKTWDISSRGTGVTCLAPGSAAATRPLKTGAGTYGYGCGLADTSELIGSAVMSEIFHIDDINTERVLLILNIGNGMGIGVRAAPNLTRPAHLFLHLKQGQHAPLKKAADILIQRQIENQEWNISPKSRNKYNEMLMEVATNFAVFAARMERDYIFVWMDWDGDNVLSNGGIIDYGSIRRFGLRHDQYRYDDVERWSTNLNEQKAMARQIVQVFAQATQFIETGKKQSIQDFADCEAVQVFDRKFKEHLQLLTLKQVGLTLAQITNLAGQQNLVRQLCHSIEGLEKIKSSSGKETVPDGVNRPAAFNTRRLLRSLADEVRQTGDLKLTRVDSAWALDKMISSFSKRKDKVLSTPLRKKTKSLLSNYRNLLKQTFSNLEPKALYKALTEFESNCLASNHAGRLTGNGSEFVTQEIMKSLKKDIPIDQLQTAIEMFISSQAGRAEQRPKFHTPITSVDSIAGKLYLKLVNIADEADEEL
jgi:hypothetical protein